MSKDFFHDNDSRSLVDYGELMIYDNQYVEPLESGLTDTNLKVQQNAADIELLKQQIPGGETGKGAYLNLGGTPDRYPTVGECVGEGSDGTGFVVMAKPDGLYFYNPVTKVTIPPKSGGGNLAIHGQFPEIFDASHELKHSGRVTRSGIFFSEYSNIGITEWTDPDEACQVMVTSHVDGYEQHIVIGKEGLAYKLFKPGDNNADWVHYQGTPGGGGGGLLPSDHRFIRLLDAPDSYAGQSGKIPAVNAAEDGLEFIDPPTGGGGGTGPIDFPETFKELLDTPNDYAGHAGRMVVVNGGENGLTFVDRDPNIAETIHNVYERGQRSVDGKSLKGGYVDVSNANNFAQDCARAQLIINSDDTRERVINLAKIADGNEVALLDTHVREGRITYLHNPTSRSKRVTPAAGDGFWINGVHVTTSQNMPPHSSMLLFPTIRGGVGDWIILLNRAKEDHRPIVNWTDLDDTPTDYAGNEGKLLAVKMDNSGIEFVDHLVPSNTEEFTQLKDVPPTYIGSGGKMVVVKGSEDGLEFVDSPNHISEFTDLMDTPSDYSGHTGKMVTVNTTETGLNFTDVPTIPTDIMSEAEVEAKVAQILGGGLNLVNSNGLGGGFAQTSGDVSNTAVAAGTILVGSGSSTGKKFTMPMIVAKDVTTLSNSEVRAGRITYIINMGTQPRTIEKVSGVRFYVNGGHTDTVQTIKAGVCMVFMPGIWGDGTKSWMPIGQFNVAEASGVTSNDLYTGQVKIANRALLYVAYDYNGDIAADKMANNPFIIATGAAGNRILTLPTIMPKLTETLTSTQVREGYRLTVYNQAAGPRTLRLQSGQFFWKDWTTNTLDYAIPSKHMEDFLACKVSNNYVWIPMSRRHINNDQARFVAADKAFLDGIQNGDSYLHANAMVTPASVIASTTFTADQAATTNNLIIKPTTGSTTGTMPAIVSVSSTNIPSGSVRLGFEMTISNHGTTDVTLNYQTGSQGWNNGTFYATQTVSANSWLKVVAINTSGSTYGWAKVASGTH